MGKEGLVERTATSAFCVEQVSLSLFESCHVAASREPPLDPPRTCKNLDLIVRFLCLVLRMESWSLFNVS